MLSSQFHSLAAALFAKEISPGVVAVLYFLLAFLGIVMICKLIGIPNSRVGILEKRQSPQRPPRRAKLQAWLSVLIGVAACGFWIVLAPIVTKSLPILWDEAIKVQEREARSLFWPTVPMLCFYLLLLPGPGVILGILGLRARGYARTLAGLGIAVSLAFGLPIVGFLFLIFFHSLPRLPVG
jgi:hypothetical protein